MYDDFRGAAAKLYAHPRFTGKRFDLYVAGPMLYEDERGKALARFCVDHGGMIADEWYLQEIPTLQGAWEEINKRFAPKMRKWEASMPGITPHIVATLANETAYPENADRHPHIDFKVFMDMQMHTLATKGEFFALGGIQWYKSGYADEEILRFGGRLFRHYCIEGNTDPISDDPYELNHIANPDFEAGTEGWLIQAAEHDSVRDEHYASDGHLQGRWGKGMGDKFLLTRRSGDRPNTFTQTIKHLKPGRLYSLKMISADYQDLLAGKSDKQANAVSIELTDVEILDAPDKSFQFTYRHSFGDRRDKFEASAPYWMNLHRRIFRASASTSHSP